MFNTRSATCIDNLDIYINIDNNIIKDITFDGEACVISTSSTNIMINLLRGKTIDEAIDIIKSNGIKVYGTNVVNGEDVSSIIDKSSYALVMGNEGNGVKLNIQELCDNNLYIPMNSTCESLNVGVACSILLYELGR